MMVLNLTLVCFLIRVCMTKNPSADLSKFLTGLDANYDKRIRPTINATKVSVQIGILSMGPLSLTTMSLRSDILLRLRWHDPRLAYDNSSELTFSDDPSEIIWVPDVYIFNAIETNRHRAVKLNVRTKIGPNGHVYLSLRLSIDLSCEMDFHFYPMDTQRCSINVESCKAPVEFTRPVQLAGYQLSIDDSKESQLDYNESETFAILKAIFSIKRNFLYHFYHIYVPSMLIVMLSWSTFWIPPSAVPARVTLIVTNFLTSMLVFSNSGSGTPEVSYHTALEFFVLFNSIVIFLAMLEYLLVLSKPMVLNKVKDDCYENSVPEARINSAFKFEEPAHSTNINYARIMKECLNERNQFASRPHTFDRYSRIIFPLSYSLFVIFYFIYYFHIAS